MEKKLKLNRILVFAFFLIPGFLFSQSYQDSLKKDDDDIIAAIAPYSSDVRDAILNVSQYPQTIVKIERVQARTSQSFQDRVSAYPREEQEKFYELARYPDLIHQLVEGPPKTLEQVKPTLTNYPKETVDAVSFLFPMRLADLTAMDKMYQKSQETVDKLTNSLPSDAQADFKKVVAMPDVMNLLTERIDLVVSLGEAYKADPQGTKEKLDQQSGQINAQNQKDLDDYKKQVESDPQMQEEMKKSAQEFADSYSANGEDQSPSDAVLSQNQQPTVVNNYYYGSNYNPNPYPYWFGYPYWYSYPMWYPYPLYYHTGFYLGVGGNLVVVGLPSRAYSGWFFNYGYHRYPRYYSYCNNFYVAHRSYVDHTSVYRGFHSNVNRHFGAINRQSNVNHNINPARQESRTSTANRNASVSRPAAPIHNSNNFRNSINSNSFNRQGFSNFHATQFHQQSWGGVRGGGGSFGGGARMSGGGGHAGGGGHGRR
jgi:hypothetical protein